MGNSNKKAKEELIRLYGEECFIDRLHLRPELSKIYTGKQLKYMRKHRQQLRQLTYHHIQERSKGGKATVENGALLSEENHRWFNQQTPQNQAIMNQAFQDLKSKIDNARKCKVELVDELDLGIEIKFAEMEFKDKEPKEKYDRAKENRQTKKLIKDWEERKMITEQTRKESYEEIKKDKHSRYNEILEIIGDKEMTAREIEDKRIERGYESHHDMNHVRPRITELVNEYNELIECGVKKDYFTNKKVAIYRKTTAQEKMELENINHIPVID